MISMCVEDIKKFFKRKVNRNKNSINKLNDVTVVKPGNNISEPELNESQIHVSMVKNDILIKEPLKTFSGSNNSNDLHKIKKTKTRRTKKPISLPPRITRNYEPSAYIGRDHWMLFSSLFNRADSEIKIVTGSISSSALSLLCAHIQKHVKIRILTKRGRGYDEIFQMVNVGRENIKRCQRLHAKFCIIDGKTLITGSSNITKGSLGDHNGLKGNNEADVITQNNDAIESANTLFDLLWNEKSNIELLKNDSGFISSAYGIPLKLKQLALKAEKEITIIVPPFFKRSKQLKSIPRYLRELNPYVKIKVITSHRIGETNVEGLEEMEKFHHTDVILAKENLHCKIYVFDGKIALISSLNLYLNSWIRTLESGILTSDKAILKKIDDWVKDLENHQEPLKVIKKTEGSDNGESSEDYIEKLYFKFRHEGEILIPELNLNFKYELGIKNVQGEKDESKNNLSTNNGSPTTINNSPTEIEMLPGIISEFEIDDEKRTALFVERSELFCELDQRYAEIRKFKEYREKFYDLGIENKKLRDKCNLQVQDCKKERIESIEMRINIHSKLNNRSYGNPNSPQWKSLLKIRSEITKLWTRQCELVESAQEYHEDFILIFNEINRLRGLKKSYEAKIRLIKRCINKINIQLARLKRVDTFSEMEKELIIQDLFDYLLSCPYKSKREIKWYFTDFSTEYGVFLDVDSLFEVFHLAFSTKNPFRTAGFLFNLIKVISRKFESRYIYTVDRFFKNMILSRGRSGLEIINKKQFEKYVRNFVESFNLLPPNSENILDLIYNEKLSLNRLINNEEYFKRVCEIFQDTYSETLNLIIQKVIKERKREPKIVINSDFTRDLKLLTKD